MEMNNSKENVKNVNISGELHSTANLLFNETYEMFKWTSNRTEDSGVNDTNLANISKTKIGSL